MSTFPVSLDSSSNLPNPTGASTQASPDHASQHSVSNTSLIAVETKLGTGSSTPSSTNLLVSTGTGTSAWSKLAPTGTIVGSTDSITLTNKTLTSPTINSPTITNATLSADTITGYTTSNTGSIYGMSITAGVLALATNNVTGANLATSAITLGYAQLTSAATVTSSTRTNLSTNLTSTVTVPAGGRNVKITLFCSALTNTGTAGTGTFSVAIMDGATNVGQIYNNIPNNDAVWLQFSAIAIAPAAGSHTYNIQAAASSGTMTFAAGAANGAVNTFSPCYILVEAI